MKTTNHTRRRFITVAGSVTVAGLAGCTDTENNADDATNGDQNEEPESDPENNPDADEQEAAPEDYEEWEDVDQFTFEGRIEAWTGIEPALIEGEENPTLVLFEGEEYDFRWVNKDGAIHNIEIWDADDEVIDEYATDGMDTEDEEQVLTDVVASPEMTTYVCQYHRNSQAGEIEVRSR